jgi:hypothetical protein
LCIGSNERVEKERFFTIVNYLLINI